MGTEAVVVVVNGHINSNDAAGKKRRKYLTWNEADISLGAYFSLYHRRKPRFAKRLKLFSLQGILTRLLITEKDADDVSKTATFLVNLAGGKKSGVKRLISKVTNSEWQASLVKNREKLEVLTSTCFVLPYFSK